METILSHPTITKMMETISQIFRCGLCFMRKVDAQIYEKIPVMYGLEEFCCANVVQKTNNNPQPILCELVAD